MTHEKPSQPPPIAPRDFRHQLERERIHLLLIEEAAKGMDDVAVDRVRDAHSALAAIKRRHAKITGHREP